MDINIRRAQPEDAKIVFPMVYSSGPHEFDYIFNLGGKTFKDYFDFAFPRNFGVNSHCVYKVATVDDKVLGIGAFIYASDRLYLDLGNFWCVIRFYGLNNILKISRASSHIDTILPPPKANELYIGQLGVKEESRGQGIGSALIRHGIELARAKGLHKCVLNVAVTNPQAQRLYERSGFKVVCEHKWNYSDSPIQVPGQVRMEFVL